MDDILKHKHLKMQQMLREMGRVIVAFSAGVDSTLVLKLALDAVGADNVLAVTGVSPSLAQRELQSVRDLAALMKAPLELIQTGEMDDPNYRANPATRCFYCKSELFGKLSQIAQSRGYAAVLSGANADDSGDYRPGMSAAQKYGVRSPLLEADVTKSEARALSRELGLPTWNKPALACLSSRIPYGTPVTVEALSQIERAEDFLRDQGFSQVRVRYHQKVARIEVPVGELPRLLNEPLRGQVIASLKQIGFTYITLDLQGFRSGSGNEVLKLPQVGV